MFMVVLYIFLIAYILAINFYAFLLVKSLRDKERQDEIRRQAAPLSAYSSNGDPRENASDDGYYPPATSPNKPPERNLGKLCITGLLGGAITIYVCMFVLKYKRSDLLLMVLMPLLGVLNIYLWVLLFKSGFGFLLIR
ncbi:MAG: hypothetical protein IJX75_06050 [Clostridia bacterium]|nr:hypothetical protein [Clostridia bacterium]